MAEHQLATSTARAMLLKKGGSFVGQNDVSCFAGFALANGYRAAVGVEIDDFQPGNLLVTSASL